MEKLRITYYDEDGNESFEEYSVDEDVLSYIEDLEYDSASLFGQLILLQNELSAMSTVLEGYKILCGNLKNAN